MEMNILISQSQGETFAALSLQLPLSNTHTHIHTELNLLPSGPTEHRSSCFIPLVACLFVCVLKTVCCFTQGEGGME